MTDPHSTTRIRTANQRTLDDAAAALQAGRVIAFPTETVYGLGADATNDAAVAAIFTLKQRPPTNPLTLHVASAAQAAPLVHLSRAAENLMLAFWPGPLTLVLPLRATSGIAPLCSAGTHTLGLRCPAHKVARDLIEKTGRPIIGTSANLSGQLSPTTPQHVAETFKDNPLLAMILAAGRCPLGVESTVLDLCSETPTILRPGSVLASDIEACLNRPVQTGKTPERPFALQHPIRLNVLDPRADEAYLAFGPTLVSHAKVTHNLSEGGDLDEAAQNLFTLLMQLDSRTDIAGIAVAPLPMDGIGIALNHRLQKAAA